jgi:hypothetical protein
VTGQLVIKDAVASKNRGKIRFKTEIDIPDRGIKARGMIVTSGGMIDLDQILPPDRQLIAIKAVGIDISFKKGPNVVFLLDDQFVCEHAGSLQQSSCTLPFAAVEPPLNPARTDAPTFQLAMAIAKDQSHCLIKWNFPRNDNDEKGRSYPVGSRGVELSVVFEHVLKQTLAFGQASP